MITIRLSRHGKLNDPFYKIVAIDSRKKDSAKPIESIGYWKPKKSELKIEKDKLNDWISKGARVTNAVTKLAESITK